MSAVTTRGAGGHRRRVDERAGGFLRRLAWDRFGGGIGPVNHRILTKIEQNAANDILGIRVVFARLVGPTLKRHRPDGPRCGLGDDVPPLTH